MSCPACHLFPDTCFVCGRAVVRVDAERAKADVAEAHEASRLDIIRADVERALRDLTGEVISADRGHHNAMGDALEEMRKHRSVGTSDQDRRPHPAWEFGDAIGHYHRAARRLRRARRAVADSTRWLETSR